MYPGEMIPYPIYCLTQERMAELAGALAEGNKCIELLEQASPPEAPSTPKWLTFGLGFLLGGAAVSLPIYLLK